MPQPRINFCILGPLDIVENGRSLILRGRMRRMLLAALLVGRRQVLTADQLIDDLWGEHAPASARQSLHNLVSSLRATFRADVLETTSAGYRLQVAAEQLDSIRFERLVSTASREDAAERVRVLTTALSLWRGSPLVEVRYESFAQAEIARLEELHTWALEQRLAAELELGCSDRVIPELLALVSRFPFRERLRLLLMVALHRSGRSIEALTSFAEWHQLVSGSLGMEPGRAIGQLRDDIRRAAPELADTTARLDGVSIAARAPVRRRPRARHRRVTRSAPSDRRIGVVAALAFSSYATTSAGGASTGFPGLRCAGYPLASVAQWTSPGFPIRSQRFDSSRRLSEHGPVAGGQQVQPLAVW